MKTYYICAAIFFILAYAVFHFGFRAGGAEQLYRISDELAFEVQPESEDYNGVTVHEVRRTSPFVCFVCGEYEPDDSRVWMANAKYRSGDWVYTDFPQHESAKTDIVNLRTGEAIEANVPADFKFGDDFSKLPEYEARGLTKSDQNELTPDYVKANFPKLSSYTSRCAYINILFVVLAVLLAFPKLILYIIEAAIEGLDSSDY